MGRAAVEDTKVVAEGRCRLCERLWDVRPPTRHRIVPGRHGGRYVARNIVPLCRPCHDLIEADASARRMLRARLWPGEVSYGLRHWPTVTAAGRPINGFDWFYPPPPRELVIAARSYQGEPPSPLGGPGLVQLPRRSGLGRPVLVRAERFPPGRVA